MLSLIVHYTLRNWDNSVHLMLWPQRKLQVYTLSLLPRFDWKVWHKSRNVRLQVLKKPEFLKKRPRISTLIIVFTAYLFHSYTFPNFLLNLVKFLHYITLFDNLILKIAFSTSNNLLLLVEFYSNISVCTCTINDKKLLKNEIKVSVSWHFYNFFILDEPT